MGRSGGLGARAVSMLVAALCLLPAAPAVAQQARLEIRDGDTIKSVLAQQQGQQVGMILAGGSVEIGGKVVKVTDSVVHLTEVTGRESLDAVIRLDHVVAVLIRVRPR